MKLTLRLQILPTVDEKTALLATMERFNTAASFAAKVGFEAKVFNQPGIHALAYREIRERFGLSSQMAVRAIGKAVETFRRDKSKCPVFRERGAIVYDDRILSFKGTDRVSVWTLEGRVVLPLVYGDYQTERFDLMKGQVELVYRRGKFYLLAAMDAPESPQIEAKDFIGVDLGVAKIATDSDGNVYSGEEVENVRVRQFRNRQRLQKKGTRGAKKHLRRLSGKEANFRRHQNHVISKTLVAAAKGTGRGIVLEDLKGIRSRTTVRRRQRARHAGWSFYQLRSFVEYKAKMAGVPVLVVDPRNTSRTCSCCGHCDKANRKSQDKFVCLQCGHSMNADINAAQNLRALGLGHLKLPSELSALRG